MKIYVSNIEHLGMYLDVIIGLHKCISPNHELNSYECNVSTYRHKDCSYELYFYTNGRLKMCKFTSLCDMLSDKYKCHIASYFEIYD